MPKSTSESKAASIGAHCQFESGSFAVAVSDITPEGCSVEANEDWGGNEEFLHLKIADRVEINGRVQSCEGKRALVRFFGQIHPYVVDELAKPAR